MRRNSGFSLVEVLCAVAILGIGLVGLTQGMTAAVRSSKESEIQTAAALLAAGQIEFLRADGFLIEGEDEGEGTGGLAQYRWKQNITETETQGLYEVVVVVEQASTGQQIYELKTLLFDPPLLNSDTGETEKKRKSDRPERGGQP